MRVAGVLVAYETPPDDIRAVLRRLAGQLDRLYIVDNSSDPSVLNRVVESHQDERVRHISMGGNHGIAHAQNVGIEHARADEADFLLFLDDDSSFPDAGIEKLTAEFLRISAARPELVGIGPRVIDERSGQALIAVWNGNRIVPSTSAGEVDVAYLVSSGALVLTQAFMKYGMLKTDYFIDHVDKEWGLRVGRAGGIFVVTPQVILRHRLGDEPTQTRTGATRYRHSSAMRDYYLTRNAILLIRDLRLGAGKSWHLAELVGKTALRKLFDRSLGKDQRRAVRLGVVDGLLGRRGARWTA